MVAWRIATSNSARRSLSSTFLEELVLPFSIVWDAREASSFAAGAIVCRTSNAVIWSTYVRQPSFPPSQFSEAMSAHRPIALLTFTAYSFRSCAMFAVSDDPERTTRLGTEWLRDWFLGSRLILGLPILECAQRVGHPDH